MTLIKPIGPTTVTEPYSIKNLPPLIIGGAVFNTQYSTNPYELPVKDLISKAFNNGLIALDTSPYYGVSEELIGNTLKELKPEWNRESYFICTKAGRVKLNDFDYSRTSVRNSVYRSLKRLNTEYLDLVYMHDIEFVKENEIFDALRELKLLKDEGIIKNFGISGYPVKFLYKVALSCKEKFPDDIGALDAILSYSNGCIQNTILFEYYNKFFDDCGIKKLMNGSILSMSLLRSGVTHSFHPASNALKEKVQSIAEYLKENYDNLELADLSTRFALKNWLFDTIDDAKDSNNELVSNKKTSIVLGVSNLEELDIAISNYWQVKLNDHDINTKDIPVFKKVQDLLGEEHFNETWESGSPENN